MSLNYKILPSNMTPASPYGMSLASGGQQIFNITPPTPAPKAQAFALAPKPVAPPKPPTAPAAPAVGGPAPTPLQFANDAYTPQANKMFPTQGSTSSTDASITSSPSTASQANALSSIPPAGTSGTKSGVYYDSASQAYVQDVYNWDPSQGKYVSQKMKTDPTTGEQVVAEPVDMSTLAVNARRIAGYKPEMAQIDQGKYEVTHADLIEPKRSDYATNAEYNEAMRQFADAVYTQQKMINDSGIGTRVADLQSQAWAREEERARQTAAAAAESMARNELKPKREALIRTLAARGLNINTDTDAINQLAQFDSDAQKLIDLKMLEAKGGTDVDFQQKVQKRIDAERQAVTDRLKAASDMLTEATNRTYKTDLLGLKGRKATLDEKKAQIDEAYKNGTLDLRERDLAIKQAEADSKAELRTAQTDLTKAKTETEIHTLPLKLQESKARIDKALRASSKSYTAMTDDEYADAYRLASMKEKSDNPSDKAVEAAARYLKSVPLDTALKETRTQRKEATQDTTRSTGGGWGDL